MKYYCCDINRRNDVESHPFLNGIEFLEVIDNPSDTSFVRQTTLLLHFVKPINPGSLSEDQVSIEGGDRIQNISVIGIEYGYPESPLLSPPTENTQILIIRVNQAGDFSTYTLRLIKDKDHADLGPPDFIDPILSTIDFTFKINCPSDFDCALEVECEKETPILPDINYLAKDYASFRQLMFDRMSLLIPEWTERNPADLGVALVELLAYCGDYLSYKQDAIATEAYLGTARKRTSVRRHVRLVDYPMHEGCNSRTWVHIKVKSDFNLKLPITKTNSDGSIGIRFLTNAKSELPYIFTSADQAFQTALIEDVRVFELMHDEILLADHNEMNFYTWGDRSCCLPKGATSATLAGFYPYLKEHQVLIFQEVKGPETGSEADADPLHRHVVRLTKIRTDFDPLYPVSPIESPLNGTPVTRIEWHKEDKLPFPLCISNSQGANYYENISIALGNNVLVDHGYTIKDDLDSSLDPSLVSASSVNVIINSSGSCCEETQANPVLPRFRPMLKNGPLTWKASYSCNKSAYAAMKWSMSETLPCIRLFEMNKSNEEWEAVQHLLSSTSMAKVFVVEMESEGIAYLRFGDNIHGVRPSAGNWFKATYRIGNGTMGNIGRESIAHLVSDDPSITGAVIDSISNPIQAYGGVNPESLEEVRNKAPNAFKKQERTVISQDYEEMAKKCSKNIQRAASSIRWTGSWRTAFLSIDPYGGHSIDKRQLRNDLEKYRMTGLDLEINDPRYVSLQVEMEICVEPNYFANDVKIALLKVFNNKVLPGGKKGVFHPDNFSFGQTIYLSPLYAAAQSMDGVASAQIKKFKRQNDPDESSIDTGLIKLSKLEIARLDNDPNFPDRGIFTLIVKGGK